MRKIAIPLFVAACLSLLAIKRTDGFSIDKIHGELVEGRASALTDEISAKLAQPYRYLAKGRQCFVFASEDGKHVLKFLNYNRFYFPRPLSSFSLFKDYADRRRCRYRKTVDSLTLAAERLSQETGIEYLHLHKSETLPVIELIGPAGSRRTIDLNSVAFVLQKRADTAIFEKLASIAQEKGEEGLQKSLSDVLSLLQRRCALGIADDDRDIEINFAFSGEDPQLIDPGRLFLSEDLNTKAGKYFEMQAATKKLYKWLSLHYPSSANWLKSEITSESSVCENES